MTCGHDGTIGAACGCVALGAAHALPKAGRQRINITNNERGQDIVSSIDRPVSKQMTAKLRPSKKHSRPPWKYLADSWIGGKSSVATCCDVVFQGARS
jgi:hypothetical protein